MLPFFLKACLSQSGSFCFWFRMSLLNLYVSALFLSVFYQESSCALFSAGYDDRFFSRIFPIPVFFLNSRFG